LYVTIIAAAAMVFSALQDWVRETQYVREMTVFALVQAVAVQQVGAGSLRAPIIQLAAALDAIVWVQLVT